MRSSRARARLPVVWLQLAGFVRRPAFHPPGRHRARPPGRQPHSRSDEATSVDAAGRRYPAAHDAGHEQQGYCVEADNWRSVPLKNPRQGRFSRSSMPPVAPRLYRSRQRRGILREDEEGRRPVTEVDASHRPAVARRPPSAPERLDQQHGGGHPPDLNVGGPTTGPTARRFSVTTTCR